MKRLAAIFTLSLAVVVASSLQIAAASPANIYVSEVQTGGCIEYTLDDPSVCEIENGRQEFIELYNPLTESIDLTGWRVEYLSASHDGVASPTRALTELSGRILPQSYVLLSAEGYLGVADEYFEAIGASGALAKSGGSVRIVDAMGRSIDLVGWGSARQIDEWPRETAPAAGQSLERAIETGLFTVTATPSPQGGGLEEVEELTCSGVILSEILPNPMGADAGKEFIEIYNPTDDEVTLSGCSLQVGSKQYMFPVSDVLQAGEYKAFYDSTTKLTLPNRTGGEVILITHDTEEAVQYPGALGDEIAWAYINGKWQETYKPTPYKANELQEPAVGGIGGGAGLAPCKEGQYRHPETNRCRNVETAKELQPCREGQERNPATNRCRAIGAASNDLKPCQPGQERNPETNRCRSTAATQANQFTPCKPGQERNPETNRCRSTTASTSELKPCAPDQFRNPETNRCKKKEDDANTLKPCQEGWERNPDTNRCRKIRDSTEPAFAVEETPPEGGAGAQYGWWLAGAAGTGVLGYGVYEWRREIANGFRRLRGRDTGGTV